MKDKILSPVKAIRAKCLECSGQNPTEVRDCPMTECPIYPYRMGRNPSRKGIGRKDFGDNSKFAI